VIVDNFRGLLYLTWSGLSDVLRGGKCRTISTACSLATVAAGLCGVFLFSALGGCSHTPTPEVQQPAQSRPSKTDNSSGGAARNAPKPATQAEIPTSVEPFTLPNPEFKLELAPGVPLEFVGIPPGSFMMGNNKLGVRRHSERIAKSFYLGKYEVTQEQWQALMGNNPSLHKGPPKRPVERIDWDQCQAFLQKLNQKFGSTGMYFGLPTEAQWEWACRAGVAMRIDSTDNPDKIEEYGWFGTNAALETHPVGERKASRWGLYDMHGNVAEWCVNNATNMADDQPADSASPGEFHVVRGGSWRDAVRDCTSMSRVVRRNTISLRFDGFRVMCEPK
jgi:formylglycine-generating enzyme required for sulfatase activity